MKPTTKYQKQLVSWQYGRDESPMMYILHELLRAKKHGADDVTIPAGSEIVYSSSRYTIHQDADGYYYLSELLPVGTHQERNDAAENRAHCKHIAESLDEYVNDCVKRCPHCGEIHVRDWSDVGDVFKCPNCDDVDSVDNWEWLTVWDYLTDAYDVEFRVGSDKEVRSVRVMVACGGPNIYINTASGDVELYWWTDTARYGLSRDAINAVNEWAADYWGCL